MARFLSNSATPPSTPTTKAPSSTPKKPKRTIIYRTRGAFLAHTPRKHHIRCCGIVMAWSCLKRYTETSNRCPDCDRKWYQCPPSAYGSAADVPVEPAQERAVVRVEAPWWVGRGGLGLPRI